ncbi:silicon efflux transporter LSI2 isoform X2 [Zea mays]|uniref:Divalent ion symporter n=2 Tax=Zea mays TaxID=4577 RepID=A0A1D6GPX1_MAIZE|nr:silicon efflux transporter LSI2 isoform X2 [Zea mays]AQK65218.1 Divalent ion symporter [Zea mays]AQK65219.1 Divalent ion symporter [Zea mays]AQK65221.1 Divalent ion symporter [Zea mays]|eukprot:XP_008644817.1 silicon efflux transporter LSI2 isoform X2 [Zea mays]
MTLASTDKVVLGCVAFSIFWVLAVFPSVPFMPVGRTAGSLLGAMLMVLFRVMTPDEAYKAIDLPILGLLFGTMVVSIFLERADMFEYLGGALAWRSRGSKDLLLRVCLVSAVASALFTNDTCCVVLTEFILKLARQNGLPPQPFLLALASSSNIGSAATPIGNPQNLVIAVQSGITFGQFLVGVFPAMAVGVAANTCVLLCYFWRYLAAPEKDQEAGPDAVVADEEVTSHRFTPARMSHASSMNGGFDGDCVSEPMRRSESLGRADALRSRSYNSEGDIQVSIRSMRASSLSQEMVDVSTVGDGPRKITRSTSQQRSVIIEDAPPEADDDAHKGKDGDDDDVKVKRWKVVVWKSAVYLTTLGMLVALLMGLNMSWSAITAALVLLALDFTDAQACLEKVSYSLLIFFCGMFITVDGFNKTGIPNALWELVEPYSRIDSARGTALLALVILVLSNVASNVPTVLLLGSRVAASAAAISPESQKKAWLILAWVSTVSGNLTLLGSAANLIVCEQARRAQFFGYNLTFWSHLRFGLPSTIIVTAIGLLIVVSY